MSEKAELREINPGSQALFDAAERVPVVDKATFKDWGPKIREALLDTQFELHESASFPVIIVLGGNDLVSRGALLHALSKVMDSRNLSVVSVSPPTDEERARPRMWRFWRALPPKGRIGVFYNSWYTYPGIRHSLGESKAKEFNANIDEINRFEELLAAEGALIVKVFVHLSKKQLKKRLKSLERDPDESWRIPDEAKLLIENYDSFMDVAGRLLDRTNTAAAPWTIIGSANERHLAMTFGNHILAALQQKLAEESKRKKRTRRRKVAQTASSVANVIRDLDLTLSLEKDDYEKKLLRYQGRLNRLFRDKAFQKLSLVAVFEGNDAAGKGGAIRRVTDALDPRAYSVIPIAAPTEEERAQPYLWRFWRHLPPLGRATIFDRSWYGRVMVERIEGFCSDADWQRAYGEINEFEAEMARHGIIVAKFWLAISKDEQERRFKDREKVGYKRYKLTDEDWRNREKWDLYENAVAEMVDRTSTSYGPWTLVEAESKYFSRVKVLKTLVNRLEKSI